jgi:hypothetical protein
MIKHKFLSLCMAFLAGSISLSAQTSTLSSQLGKLQSATQTAQGLLIRAENGQVFLSVYQPTVIRLRAVNQSFKPDSSQAVIRTASGGFSKLTESSTEILVNTDSILVRISKSPVRFSFYNSKTGAFLSGVEWHPSKQLPEAFTQRTFYWLGRKNREFRSQREHLRKLEQRCAGLCLKCRSTLQNYSFLYWHTR